MHSYDTFGLFQEATCCVPATMGDVEAVPDQVRVVDLSVPVVVVGDTPGDG